jgi:hypothetical protein
MISIFRSIDALPVQGPGLQDTFTVITTAISGEQYVIQTGMTATAATKLVAKRLKGTFYCPVHEWMVGNPDRPTICPGDAHRSETPWIRTDHEVRPS